MENIQNDSHKKGLPFRCYVYMTMAFVLPIVCFPIIGMASEAFTMKEALWFYMQPKLLIMLGFAAVIAIVSNLTFSKRMQRWDGTEETTVSVNRELRLFEHCTIGIIFAYVYAMAFVALREVKKQGIQFEGFYGGSPVAYFVLSVFSCISIISLFAYVLWHMKIEHAMDWLPYKKKYETMSIAMRNMTTAFFGVAGMAFANYATVAVPKNARMVSEMRTMFILKEMAPANFFTGTLVLLGLYFQSRATKKAIRSVEEYSKKMSKKDYAQEKVPVLSRSELGSLANDVNNIGDISRDLMRDFRDNINESNKTTSLLVENQ